MKERHDKVIIEREISSLKGTSSEVIRLKTECEKKIVEVKDLSNKLKYKVDVDVERAHKLHNALAGCRRPAYSRLNKSISGQSAVTDGAAIRDLNHTMNLDELLTETIKELEECNNQKKSLTTPPASSKPPVSVKPRPDSAQLDLITHLQEVILGEGVRSTVTVDKMHEIGTMLVQEVHQIKKSLKEHTDREFLYTKRLKAILKHEPSDHNFVGAENVTQVSHNMNELFSEIERKFKHIEEVRLNLETRKQELEFENHDLVQKIAKLQQDILGYQQQPDLSRTPISRPPPTPPRLKQEQEWLKRLIKVIKEKVINDAETTIPLQESDVSAIEIEICKIKNDLKEHSKRESQNIIKLQALLQQKTKIHEESNLLYSHSEKSQVFPSQTDIIASLIDEVAAKTEMSVSNSRKIAEATRHELDKLIEENECLRQQNLILQEQIKNLLNPRQPNRKHGQQIANLAKPEVYPASAQEMLDTSEFLSTYNSFDVSI